MSNVTTYRKRIMHHGDVFVGLNKIKDPKQRQLKESQRHCKFMDMQGSPRINPVKWADEFAKSHSRDSAIILIERILSDLNKEGLHPATKSYLTSEMTKKNIVFYKNAVGYLRNKRGNL